VLWIVYLASDTKAFAWVGFGLLLVVATLGFAMLALWLQRRQATSAVAAPGAGGSAGIGEGSVPVEQLSPCRSSCSMV
jgi:hypothetical protein